MTIEQSPVSDCISVVSSNNSSLFDMTCVELGNKNVRIILKEIANGSSTSSELACKTRSTIQNVIKHLNRLEKIGLITKDGFSSDSIKGRSAARYKITHAAVLLIPEEVSVTSRLLESIHRKSSEVLNNRLLVSFAISLSWLFSMLRFVWPLTENAQVDSTRTPPGFLNGPGVVSSMANWSELDAAILILLTASVVFIVSFVLMSLRPHRAKLGSSGNIGC